MPLTENHFVNNLFCSYQTKIDDSEISKLATLFKANTLETVALQFLGATEVEIDNYRMNNIENIEKFKRELIYGFRNKGHNRKVFLVFWEKQ